MRTSDALDQMGRYQARVLEHVAQARRLVRAHEPDARARLAQARWHLMRLLREYQLFKHVEIFDPVLTSVHRERAGLARRLKASCIAAGEDYRAHALRWSSEDIVADWPGYRQAVERMADAVEKHLADERAAVAMLLSGTERTRRN